MLNENEIEIKCVFGLLDPNNTKEIHVQQVNNLINSLENSSPVRRRSKTTVDKPEENNVLKIKQRPIKEIEKKNNAFVISNQRAYPKRNSLKKPLLEATEGIEKNLKTQEPKVEQKLEHNGSLLNVPDPEQQEFSLKTFPNRKKSMNYDEFSGLYEDIFSTNSVQEDILLKCFSVFDSEK